MPRAHLSAFERFLFSRLYIHSVPPILCVGDSGDKTTFIYVSTGGFDTVADVDSATATSVGLEASLQRTDAALRHRGLGGVVAAVACRGNPNAVLAIVLLRRLLSLLQECAARAGGSPTPLNVLGLRRAHANLDEAFILTHADVVFEILDEAIDRGIPQTSDPKVLLLFAEAGGGLKGPGGVGAQQADSSEAGTKLAAQATGTAPWRRQGIRYRKNEVYVDVVEKVHALVAQNGAILKQEVEGKVTVRSLLSGMPECRLTINERIMSYGGDRGGEEGGAKVQSITNAPLPGAPGTPHAAPGGTLEATSIQQTGELPVVAQRAGADSSRSPSAPSGARGFVKLSACRYHQCVRLGKSLTERTLAFTPPDGTFELMTYRQALCR